MLAPPLLHTSRPRNDLFLTLGIAPGVIRFVRIIDLQNSNSVRLEEEVDALLSGIADARLQFLDWGEKPMLTFAHHLGKKVPQDQFNIHDSFCASHFATGIESLTEACSVFESVVREFRVFPFPSICYRMFCDFLRIGDFRLREFVESWCPDALRDNSIFASYSEHANYCVYQHGATEINGNVVFKRTSFVDDRIGLIKRVSQHELEIDDQDGLAQTHFKTFVYLMEDLRNKRIKIGRSSSPRKREKTLQSEVPEVQLRFAIPCEGTMEKKLHTEFAERRVRGEWFELTSNEILEVIMKLGACGDSTRIVADYNWIGMLVVQGKAGGKHIHREHGSRQALRKRSFDEILTRAQELLSKGDDGKAIHELDQLLLRNGRLAHLYILRARVELRLGNLERALQDTSDAIRIEPNEGSAYRLRGKVHHKLREFDRAISDFDRVISLDPMDAKARAIRGALKINVKDYLGAIQDLDEVVSIDSSLAMGFRYRAEANLRRGQLNDAMRDFNEAIRLDSDNTEAFIGRGMTNHRCANFSASLLDYEEALSREPHHKRGRINKAFLLATAEDQDVFDPVSGGELLTSVLESEPENSYALNAKACALASLDDFSSAIDVERKAMLNNRWLEDSDIDGGACASHRIACWQLDKQWYPEVG